MVHGCLYVGFDLLVRDVLVFRVAAFEGVYYGVSVQHFVEVSFGDS